MKGGPAAGVATVEAVFADAGPLARAWPGYEPRDGQRRMAAAVAQVLEDGGTLLAEAGTGTGKTLAYLVPAILSGKRVLVSTGTKNLQEQILFMDLPALQQALGLSFTATLMKGRGNYLCLHRWEMFRDGVEGGTSAGGRLIESGDRLLVPLIEAWLPQTSEGDRAELRELPEDLPAWREIAADVETCLGSECPRHADCFVTRMRQRAAESDVVIVNHHLLCADAAVRQGDYGEVIPHCPTLVVDEAHGLEEVATQYFGHAFSSHRAEDLAREVMRHMAGGVVPATVDLTTAVGELTDRARAFHVLLSAGEARTETRARYSADSIADICDAGLELAGALEWLEHLLDRPAAPGGSPAVRDPGDAGATVPADADAAVVLARRAGALCADLRFLLRASDPGFVYFLERRGRSAVLRAAPIDVSRLMQDVILQRYRTVVLTSATLTVDRAFTYTKARLGIGDAGEIQVASEFDYAARALLYLPRRMPAPRHPSFATAAARETIELLKRSRGRAFLLFTSYAMLREVQRFVEMALPFPTFVQGTAPRSTLVERFRQTPNAVLLGTASFWQGVDVVGDALSCVVIDKLPFASPGDPVTAARIEALREAGGDPFAEYQVPLAVLALQQGLGRLLRHRTDRGVLAILDPRLRTMGYGRRFLDSLPPAPVTHDLDAVERFFK